MIPELNNLINEINEERPKRKIVHIKHAMDKYLIALDKTERDIANQKTWRYRVRAWWAGAFFA